MRTKYEGQELIATLAAASFADGVTSVELDIPTVEPGDAILVRKVFIQFTDGTDSPHYEGA